MIVKLISVLRVIIGLVFVVSGFGKLIDVHKFADIIRSYEFLSDFLIIPFSISLSIFEILLGMMFLLKVWIKFASVFLLFLSFLFLSVMIYGFYYLGVDDCGCFGAVLSINDRLINILKSVILIVLVSLYVLFEKLYDFKSFLKLVVLIVLISSLSVLIFGFDSYDEYGGINLSFLGSQIDSSRYYFLIIFSPFDCHSCLSSMVPVWNRIDSVYSDIKVLGIAYSSDDRVVNYVLNRYGFSFEVRRFDYVPIDFTMTPVEVLTDGFGRIYYRVEGVKPSKAHVNGLIRAINKILKQKGGKK